MNSALIEWTERAKRAKSAVIRVETDTHIITRRFDKEDGGCLEVEEKQGEKDDL